MPPETDFLSQAFKPPAPEPGQPQEHPFDAQIPSAQPAPVDFLTQAFGQQNQQERLNAMAKVLSPVGPAQDAAKAHKAAKATGLPADVTISDPEGFSQQAIFEQTQGLVSKNPHLQRYVNEVPNAAQVSQGDFDKLDKASQTLGWLTKWGHQQMVNASLFWNSPGAQALLGVASGADEIRRHISEGDAKAITAFNSAFQGESRTDESLKMLPPWQRALYEYTMLAPAARAIEATGRLFAGSAKAVGSIVSDKLESYNIHKMDPGLYEDAKPPIIPDDVAKERLERETQAFIDAETARQMGTPHVVPTTATAQFVEALRKADTSRTVVRIGGREFPMRVGESDLDTIGFPTAPGLDAAGFMATIRKAGGLETPGSFSDIDTFVRQLQTGEWDPSKYHSKGMAEDVAALRVGQEYKPPDPARQIGVIRAEVAAETVQKAVDAVNETKTKEISPDHIEQFIDKRPEGDLGTVYLKGERVLQLYKAEGKLPAEGDGMLGFVPDLINKAKAAAETGGEIAIPMGKYIAHVDPTIHEKLKDDLRLHDDGVTLNEAEVMKKTEPSSEMHSGAVDLLHSRQPEAFERIHAQTPAALKYGDEVFVGQTHAEILADQLLDQRPDLVAKHTPENEGFLTTHNRFVDREEAFQIALKAKQGIVEDLPEDVTQLTAEDLINLEDKPPKGQAERELKAEAAVEAAKKAEAQAKAEGKVEEEKPLVEEEAPTKAPDLAPAKETRKAKPGANTKRLAQLLGPKLYGDPTNMDLVSVKEMLQNSFDALKSLLEKGQAKNPKIDITFDRDKRQISVVDNGSGMTADVLGGPFLQIAGTSKEAEQSSGGFGIAKMLFLFGNKDLRVVTMRDGKVSTLVSTGEQLFNALENEADAPVIKIEAPTKEHKAMFPEGHGTSVTVTLPESFKDPSTGEMRAINFRSGVYSHQAVQESPLFHPIEVNWHDKRYATAPKETLPIGANFPHDKFTQLANVKFDWGTARIYVSKGDLDRYHNLTVLSNGIFQFSSQIKKDARDPYGDNIPNHFYLDIDSKAKPTDPGYPFDLNRQGFTQHAKEDLKKITNYIQRMHQQSDFATMVKNFGDIQYYDEKGVPGEKQLLAPDIPERETPLAAISAGDKVEVKDGKLIVNNREIPDLSESDLKGAGIKFDELMMDQSKIDPNSVMLHDNIEVYTGPNGYVSLVTLGREEFGARFDSYAFGIGNFYRQLRDVVADVMNYPDLTLEAVGISFDQEYRGVSIKLPFSGMFLNPAAPRYTDPIRAAVGMVGTMIHEFAHHKVRSHDADFPAEMQDIIIALDAMEHMEGKRISLKEEPWFSLVKFKEQVIAHVQKHEDVLRWLHDKISETGEREGQPLVRNRGKRFKESGERQATDAGVPRRDEGPAKAVPSGYESYRPAFEPIDEEQGPAGVPPEPPAARELSAEERKVASNPAASTAAVATKKARRELYLDPLLTKGKTLNIDQTMYRRYSDLIEKAELHVLTKAVEIANKEIAKIHSAHWEAEKKEMRPVVEKELLRTPTWAADRFFNWDKGMLPGGKRIVSFAFREMGEAKADEWAPVFGFETGSQMTSAVLAQEMEREAAGKGPKWQLKQHVEAEVNKRMQKQFGSLQDNIAIEASEEALAGWNVDLLHHELKMLAAANGREPPLTREDLNVWLARVFGDDIASEVSFERSRKATEKSGKEVEKSLLKDSIKDALTHAQARVKNFVLAREAKKFEKEREKDTKLFDKYAKAVNLPKVDQEYTDQIQKILADIGWKVKRDVANIDYNLKGKTLAQFIAEKDGQGRSIPNAYRPTGKTIKEYTVNEWRDLATMIRAMDHHGRFEKVMEIRGKVEDFNNLIDRMIKNIETMRKPEDHFEVTGPLSGSRKAGRYIDSYLLKAERLFDFFDMNDPHGDWNSLLRGLIEGEQGKGDMLTKLSGMVKKNIDRSWSRSLSKITDNKELLHKDTGKPMKFKKLAAIGIALNYGNKSNRKHMLTERGWSEGDVERYLARELNDKDWDMVNFFHSLFEPLAPLVEKVTAAKAGVAVPLIPAAPYLKSKGGYWPLIEDPASKQVRAKTKVDLFEQPIYDPLPSAPALHRRTGAIYPIDFNALSRINNIINQTVHAVYMQEPVIAMNRVVRNPMVMEAVQGSMGPEYIDLMHQWIDDVAANGGNYDDKTAAFWSRALRENVTTALMGWKVSTAFIHAVSAGASTVYELGKLKAKTQGPLGFAMGPLTLMANIAALKAGNLPEIARRFFASDSNMTKAINEVMELSGEMRNRQRSLQKDFGFQMQTVLRQSIVDDYAYYRALWQANSMAMVAYLDMLTATPVWKAVYEAEMAKASKGGVVPSPEDKANAVYAADKAVREAHGSASLVSRANIGRGSEWKKWSTIAYNGYWNHNYNKWRGDVPEIFGRGGGPPPEGPTGEFFAGGADDDPGSAAGRDPQMTTGARIAMGAAFLTCLLVIPALFHHLIRPPQKKHDEDDGEIPWGAMAEMGASQFAGMVPGVNGLTYSIIHGRDPQISPADELMRVVTDMWKDQMVSKHPKHEVKHLAKTLPFVLGLPPTNQIIDTFSFLNQARTGEKEPESTGQWARGVLAIGDKGKNP